MFMTYTYDTKGSAGETLLSTYESHMSLLKEVIEPDDHKTLVTDFLEKGLPLNTQLRRGQTPVGIVTLLEASIQCGALNCMRELLERGADPNSGGRCGHVPLVSACKQPGEVGLNMVKMLLEKGASVDRKYVNGNTALLEAVVHNDAAKVKVLIEAGCDVLVNNNGGDTALHLAAIRGNSPIIKLLLEAGLDVNVRQSLGPSRMAVNILNRSAQLSGEASVSERPQEIGRSYILNAGISPLHLTAYGPHGGHEQAAKILLDAGADADAVMDSGRTTLHLCAMRNAHCVARLLLRHGCQVDCVSEENEEHKTPLLKAVDAQHVQMVEILLDAGADINTCDHWGLTPLITAIFKQSANIVSVLLQYGCNIEQTCKNGMSPFMAALRKKDICFLEMLVAAGCKLPHRGEHGLFLTEGVDIFDNPNYLLMPTMSAGQKEWFVIIMSEPAKLVSLCRVSIRACLGVNIQEKIELLPVPPAMKQYIRLSELDQFREL